MDPFEQPPSPAKNFLGGSGCGCGCLGSIVGIVAVVFIAALSMGYISQQSAGTVYLGSGVGITVAVGLVVLGVVMWLVSVLLD